MDTIKILLGATVALLLAAVVLSWKNLQHNVDQAPPDELARVRKQLTELEVENQRLATERELQNLRGANPAGGEAAVVPVPRTDKMAELEKRLADTEDKLAATQADKEKSERDAKVAKDEAGLIAQRDLEKRDKELRRARMIADAMVMATVKEFVQNDQVGSFAVIEIQRPENVQPGTILAVRRKTGILCQLRVDEITGKEAVANPLQGTSFGSSIDLQPGDELIVPPAF